MKIVFIRHSLTSPFERGNAVIIETLSLIDKNKFKISFVIPQIGTEKSHTKINGIDCYFIKVKSKNLLLRMFEFNVKSIFFSLKKFKDTDIFHTTPSSFLSGFFLSKILFRPLVVDFKRPDSLEIWEGSKKKIANRIQYFFHTLIERLIMKYSDAQTYISDMLRDYYESRYGKKPISEICTSCAPKKWCNIKIRYKKHFKNITGFYMGTLDKRRKLDNIIKTISICTKRKIPVKFVFIGDGNSRQELIKLTKKLKIENNIDFINSIPHEKILEYIRDSDFCLSYVPNTINFNMCPALKTVESMGLGKPVIATNLDSQKFYIQHMKNGILVPDKNLKAIADAIEFLYKNPKKSAELGKNARETVKKKFTMEEMANRYERLYCKLSEECS